MLNFNDEKLNSKYSKLRAKEAERLAQTMSNKYGVPYIDLSRVSINTDALRLIPEDKAKEANVAAFSFSGTELNVAALSPQSQMVEEILDGFKKDEVKTKIYVTTPESLKRAWERYSEISTAFASKSGQIDISKEQLEIFTEQIHTTKDVTNFLKKATNEDSNTSALLEIVLAGAITLDASDVHIEPEEHAVRFRYRLDGVLMELATIPTNTYRLLSSRIKLVSALKLNVRSMRQDGRFSIDLGEKSIEIRTSIIPGAYGESIVLRLLDPDNIKVGLESLGMNEHMLSIVREEIKKPNGMILTTGPTGSGKTTTLYSFLREINKPGIKVITIEDPIEYHLEGIVQTQVKAMGNKNQVVLATPNQASSNLTSYTFNEGLKSAMRQDPDIIMVGEIRDDETAGTAIDAALTGHLVFSTLHTNNAAGAIPRLLDLKVNPKVIGPALTLAMAQRLVRKLDKNKEMADPTPEEREKLERHLEAIKARGIEVPELGKIGKPVKSENSNGYKGRIGIFEAVRMTDPVKQILTQNPGEKDILNAAEDQKILSMAQDGVIKVVQGITSIEELERVVSL